MAPPGATEAHGDRTPLSVSRLEVEAKERAMARKKAPPLTEADLLLRIAKQTVADSWEIKRLVARLPPDQAQRFIDMVSGLADKKARGKRSGKPAWEQGLGKYDLYQKARWLARAVHSLDIETGGGTRGFGEKRILNALAAEAQKDRDTLLGRPPEAVVWPFQISPTLKRAVAAFSRRHPGDVDERFANPRETVRIEAAVDLLVRSGYGVEFKAGGDNVRKVGEKTTARVAKYITDVKAFLAELLAAGKLTPPIGSTDAQGQSATISAHKEVRHEQGGKAPQNATPPVQPPHLSDGRRRAADRSLNQRREEPDPHRPTGRKANRTSNRRPG